VEHLADRWRAAWTTEKKLHASVARAERNGFPVLLSRPQTFMNSSGEAVEAMMAFYRVPLARLLVAVDDADLPLGEIRLRARGNSGKKKVKQKWKRRKKACVSNYEFDFKILS